MKLVLIILFANFLCPAFFAKDLGQDLKGQAMSLWSKSADNLKQDLSTYGKCEWKNNLKTNFRYEYIQGKEKLLFFEEQIVEASFLFLSNQQIKTTLPRSQQQHLQGFFLTFGNPADKVDKNSYLEALNSLKDKIKTVGELPAPKTTGIRSGSWLRYTCLWKSPQYSICLRWAYSSVPRAQFKAKPVKLSVFYTPPLESRIVKSNKEPLNKYGKMLNDDSVKIKNGEGGDKFLEIPMVAERSRLYNLPVAIERIIRYYNQLGNGKNVYEIDNRELKKNENWLDRIPLFYATSRFLVDKRLGAQKLICPDCFEDFKNFCSLLSRYYNRNIYYNSQYARGGTVNFSVPVNGEASNISFKVGVYRSISTKLHKGMYIGPSKRGNINYVFLDNLIEVIQNLNDEETLMKVRCKSSRVKHFKARICQQIKDGKPVLWDVILGLIKVESDPPYKGEYIRIIIGFNDQTDELIYTDNLGSDHKIKKMPWDKAWAITYETLVLKRKKNLK
jgi:hypothetical protein